MLKTCPVCNKTFEVRKHKNQVYCSRQCAGLTQRKTDEIKCDYCGKLFYKAKSQTKLYKKHFCSNECRHKAKRGTDEIYYELDYAYMFLQKDNEVLKVLFDVADVGKVKQYKWHLHLRKKDTRYDVCSNTFGKSAERKYLILPRFLLDVPQGLTVDHVNRNTLDNRRHNLRIVSIYENNLNKSNNTSGCVGVTWDKSKRKWQANFKSKFLGRYEHFADAVNARKEAEKAYQLQNL